MNTLTDIWCIFVVFTLTLPLLLNLLGVGETVTGSSVFPSVMCTALRVSHVKVLFLWLMCHSELFCGQLSTVPCESTLGSAKAELTF